MVNAPKRRDAPAAPAAVLALTDGGGGDTEFRRGGDNASRGGGRHDKGEDQQGRRLSENERSAGRGGRTDTILSHT